MSDLNTLIPSDSPLFLVIACSINASGEIIGIGINQTTGEMHGYVATPRTGNAGHASLSAVPEEVSPMIIPERTRSLLEQQLRFGRFGPRLMGHDERPGRPITN